MAGEQEQLLVRALRAASPATRLRAERMVEEHRALVHWALRRTLRLSPTRTHDYDEAAAEGLLILWRACLGFDPARDVRFTTYANTALVRGLLNWRQRQNGLKVGGRPVFALRDGVGHVQPEARPEPPDPAEADVEFEALLRRGRLKDKELLILRRRFRDGRTLQEVGRELGVSKERIRQIEGDAVWAVARGARG